MLNKINDSYHYRKKGYYGFASIVKEDPFKKFTVKLRRKEWKGSRQLENSVPISTSMKRVRKKKWTEWLLCVEQDHITFRDFGDETWFLGVIDRYIVLSFLLSTTGYCITADATKIQWGKDRECY